MLNYLTGLGFLQDDDTNFKKFWESNDVEIVHLMSKEITRFHCIYWPIILEMLELRKPSKYISHGWIITEQGKMSKSLGNVLDPFYFIKKYGRDAFRFYLLKELSLKDDSVFSEELFVTTFNKDLANNVGNLFSRLIGMVKKYRNGIIPAYKHSNINHFQNMINKIKEFDSKIIDSINSLKPQTIIQTVIDLIVECNLFIELSQPWNLFKENNINDLDAFLSLVGNIAKRVIFYLEPVLVDGMVEALKIFNIDKNDFTIQFVNDFGSLDNYKLNEINPLYLRIEKEK